MLSYLDGVHFVASRSQNGAVVIGDKDAFWTCKTEELVGTLDQVDAELK